MSHAFETLTNEFVANDFCYQSLLLIIINEFVAFNIKYLPCIELLTSRVESSHESKTLNFKVLFIKLEYN